MIHLIESKLSRPTLADRDWVRKALQFSGRDGADFCFGTIYMWSPVYDYCIADIDGMFVGRSGDSYSLPAGDGDASYILRELMEESEAPLKLHAICEYQKTWMEETFPGRFSFTEDRDNEDYIYSVKDLAALSGKKYHGKRNHCSAFEKANQWTYEPMTDENAMECLVFSEKWLEENQEKLDSGTDQEFSAISRALGHFSYLGFVGGVLRVDGNICAYTFGEPINDQVFDCHVEKADSFIRGAYPMINREFARNSISDYQFVNREEDMGLEGLRKAKESYHPVKLLKKYRAVEVC